MRVFARLSSCVVFSAVTRTRARAASIIVLSLAHFVTRAVRVLVVVRCPAEPVSTRINAAAAAEQIKSPQRSLITTTY